MRVLKRALILIPVFCAMVVIHAAAKTASERRQAPTVPVTWARTLRPAVLRTIANSDKINVFCLRDYPRGQADVKQVHIVGYNNLNVVAPYYISAVGPVMDSKFARRLSLALSRAEYSRPLDQVGVIVPARFTPEIAYRVRDGDKVVTIAICFRSSTMDVTSVDETKGVEHRSMVPFQTQHNELKQLTYEALGAKLIDLDRPDRS